MENVDEFAEYANGKTTFDSVSEKHDDGCDVDFTKEKVQDVLRTCAARHGVDQKDCKLTFFELEPKDRNERSKLFKKLLDIGIESYLKIKQEWLKNVLVNNEVKPDEISAILTYRYINPNDMNDS